MRISDWSSDVCSSDLLLVQRASAGRGAGQLVAQRMRAEQLVGVAAEAGGDAVDRLLAAPLLGEEFRGAGNVAQCVGRQLHRRPVGDPAELALGGGLAVEEDGFTVAGRWGFVPRHTATSGG